MSPALEARGAARVALVTDFDGTAVTPDVGDALVEALLPDGAAALERLNREVEEGRMTLLDLQRAIWPLVRASEAAALEVVHALVRPRPGFAEVVREHLARGGRVVVASGGFHAYIRPVLARLLGAPTAARIEVHANALCFDAVRGAEASFPLREALGCERCAVCKGRVLDALAREGVRTVFCGDGVSDRCAIARASALFCVRGSSLERHARARGAAFESFDDYRAVGAALRRLVELEGEGEGEGEEGIAR